MAKQSTQVNNSMKQEQARLGAEHQQFMGNYQPKADEAYNFGQGARNDIYGGYKNLLDPNFIKQFGGSYAGLGGGHVAPQLQAAKLSLDPRFQNLESKYYDPLAGSALDAQKGYNEFAQTGGWSPEMQSNYRARIASGTPEMFQAIQRQMGNQGSNRNAALAKSARGLAQGLGQAKLEGELGLANQINQGRQWGIAGQGEMGGIGLSGMATTAAEAQRIADFNEQERVRIANQQAQANASAANANSASAQAAADQRARMYMAGLGGMQDVWGQSGQPTGYDQMLLQGRGMAGDQIGSMINQRAQYNPNRGFFDYFNAGIGALGAF